MSQLRRQADSGFPAKTYQQMMTALSKARYSSPLYERQLKGRHPLKLLGTPTDPWEGSMTAGSHLLADKFFSCGQILKNPAHAADKWSADEIWTAEKLAEPPNDRWLEYLHSFCWLRDLDRVVDRRAARVRATQLVKGWLSHHDHWQEFQWRGDILARRIVNWMAYAPLILDSDDLVYRSRLLNCLARQARHLYHLSDNFTPGPAGLQALFGLIEAGLYIPYGAPWLEKGLGLLDGMLEREILSDGGVRSRNPMDQHRLLRDILRVKASFEEQHAVPPTLQAAIDRMVPLLQGLAHGDGKLALFNGAFEQGDSDIKATLKAADLAIAPQEDALISGFRRLTAGKTVIITDCGPPAPTQLSQNCHAGCLSFEMSRAAQRLIVNCGNATYFPDQAEKDLFELSRSSAAHSTLVIEHKNSSEIRKDGLIGTGPSLVTSHRSGVGGHTLIEMSHDGYHKRFGVIHQRALYLDNTGEDVRGEDILHGKKPCVGAEYKIRFHLHPDVTASLQTGNNLLLLRLPCGEGWQFRCGGAQVSLEESLYLGTRGRFRKSRQIVLSEKITRQKSVVKWSLHTLESTP